VTRPTAPIALRWMRTIARSLLALMCYAIIGATPAVAQAGNIGAPLATCIAPVRPGSAIDALLMQPRGFDCEHRQSAYGSGDFDVVARNLPPHLGRDAPVVVRFASVWQRNTTLYAHYADGAIARVALDAPAISSHLQLGAVVEVPLPTRGQRIDALLWRVKGAGNMRGVVLGASVATPADSARSNLELGAMYAAFGGLCLALLVYNFALWCALRYRFQLAYCAMVSTLAIYAFSFSGAIAWAFPAISNNDRIRINYAMLAIAVVAALSFARSFFEARVVEGWLSRLINAVAAAVLIAALVFVLFADTAPALLDRYYSIAYILVLLAVVPTLVRAYVRRSNYLWLFAVGWAAPIGFAALRIASNFHLVPYGFWLDNSTILAMSLEALLSSLAIAYRIHLVSRERDEAREQEIAARLLAATDPLTGLLNRRAFLETAIGRTGGQQLLLVDIDHFKRVNETLGHDGGDEVLRVFTRALRGAAPADAVIARLGGEEFAIVVDANSSLSASDVLDAMRAERMPFDLTVTASIGVCVGPLASEIDWKRLYRQADLALFEAKAAGRDRARHATLPIAA
jgi:diguanylate cyclase (GGDEF)-like protein